MRQSGRVLRGGDEDGGIRSRGAGCCLCMIGRTTGCRRAVEWRLFVMATATTELQCSAVAATCLVGVRYREVAVQCSCGYLPCWRPIQ